MEPIAQHYNLDRYYFEVNDDSRAAFRGLRLHAGGPAPGFSLPSLTGEMMELSELTREGPVILVFGCYSAPPAVAEVPALDALAKTMAGRATLLFVYTREIHPNEALAPSGLVIAPHRSMDEKLAAAKRFADDLGVSFTMGVDDLAGTTHRAYGGLPSCAFVVGRDGRVLHLEEWTDATELSAVMENLLAHDDPPPGQVRRVRESYSETIWRAASDGAPRWRPSS